MMPTSRLLSHFTHWYILFRCPNSAISVSITLTPSQLVLWKSAGCSCSVIGTQPSLLSLSNTGIGVLGRDVVDVPAPSKVVTSLKMHST